MGKAYGKKNKEIEVGNWLCDTNKFKPSSEQKKCPKHLKEDVKIRCPKCNKELPKKNIQEVALNFEEDNNIQNE